MPDFPKKLNKKQKERFLEMVPIYLLGVNTIKNYYNFGVTINYIIQGNLCKDCKESYHKCECELCQYCSSNRCMCDVKSYEELVDYVIKYLCLNFSDSDIIRFMNNLIAMSQTFHDKKQHEAYLYIKNSITLYFNYLRNPKKLIRKKKQ